MGHCLFMRKGETHTAPISGILASDLAVGSVVKLMENGVAVEYLIVNQGKPSGSSLYDDSCDGTWLLRKDIKEERQWHSSDVNDYANSDIQAWLNGDFFNQLGTIEKSSIKQVKIPYINGTGTVGSVTSGASGLPAKVFLLSAYEMGFTQDMYQAFFIDGACLSYFTGTGWTDSKRIGYLNEIATTWWLRQPLSVDDNRACGVRYQDGCAQFNSPTLTKGIRPALILPSTAVFDETTMLLKGVA